MPDQFKLPDVGEGLTEAEITAWHVAVGDTVTLNQVLLEVETAKAVVELPSPYAGTVLELLYGVGETVAVGSPLIMIGEVCEAPSAPATSDSTSATSDAAPAGSSAAPILPPAEPREPVLVGYGVRNSAEVRRRPRRPVLPADPVARPNGRPFATPPVRKLARTLAVDLGAVTPTGPWGRVTRDDIRLAAALPTTTLLPPARPAVAEETELRTPIKGPRKYIAEAMVRSAFTAPHVTEWLSVDITRTLKLVEELRASPATKHIRVTPLTLLARATLVTLARYPQINASWDGDASEIVGHRDVNLGIAVATPRGLIVPNIRRAQTLDFPALAGAMADLVTKARANRTTVEEMRAGTFTITNVGAFGVDGATPIINPGEAAILAFGATRQLPWNHKHKVRLRAVTTLSLSFDHRLVDGELGSHVLTDIAELMEHPARALTR